MRCFIVLALVAAASAIPFNLNALPCDFEIPEGAVEIDLKNPTNLPEGVTIVNDPSEFDFPNGLTPTDLKNGKVPAGWKKIDARATKKVGPVVRRRSPAVDCTSFVNPVVKRTSRSSISKSTTATRNFNFKTFEPVITSNVYRVNDFVVPDFFNTVRDFKSSCDWFTTGEVPDFFQAVGEAIEWTSVNVDAPEFVNLGANRYTIDQVKEMFESANFDYTFGGLLPSL